MSVKRKIMARLAVMISFVAIAAFAGMAQAHDGGWGGEDCGTHQRHDFWKVGKKLGLTDAQKAQAKTIFQANKEAVKPIIASLRAEHKNLQALIQADKVDEAAIRAESAKIAAIQADLNVNRANIGAQFRAILTPGQLATLKTLRQKHQKSDDVAPTPAPAPAN